MDCFYAQVEMRDNPKIKYLPVAVGFDGPRSVICAANYRSRIFGVKSAMPVSHAKNLCPDLVIVNARMDVYREISKEIQSIFEEYTNIIQPLSLDEAFLDVTDCKLCYGSGTLIAQEIRHKIFERLNLTASAGVAPNKFLAKIASDENKPNGQCVITPDDVPRFVSMLPLRKIPGIGPKTSEKYKEFGLETCQDVRRTSDKMLKFIAGNFSETLHDLARGIDNREVETNRARKSLSVETTFNTDLSVLSDCKTEAEKLMPRLIERLEKLDGKSIAKLGVKLKFSDFTQTTVESRSDSLDIALFLSLLEKAFERRNNLSIRLIGLTIGFDDKKKAIKQYSLEFD